MATTRKQKIETIIDYVMMTVLAGACLALGYRFGHDQACKTTAATPVRRVSIYPSFRPDDRPIVGTLEPAEPLVKQVVEPVFRVPADMVPTLADPASRANFNPPSTPDGLGSHDATND